MNSRYNKEMLEAVVKECYSISQVLTKLNLRPSGGNYRHIPKLIKKFEIDISHFKHQGWSKGLQLGYKRSIYEYLCNPSKFNIGSNSLRLRLLKENFFQHKCYRCLNDTWLGGKIPLELEHIDGNTDNNELSNLTLLCPNCHALTATYRGKNKKLKKLGSGLPQDKKS